MHKDQCLYLQQTDRNIVTHSQTFFREFRYVGIISHKLVVTIKTFLSMLREPVKESQKECKR